MKMISMPFLVDTKHVRTGSRQAFGADYQNTLIKQQMVCGTLLSDSAFLRKWCTAW